MTVTTDEAATLAGVDPATVRKWVLAGDLEPVRRGAKPMRFHYEDVARCQRDRRSKAWLERHAEAAEQWLAGIDADQMAR